MNVRVDQDGPAVTVVISGEVDSHNCGTVGEKVEPAFESGSMQSLIVDASDLRFIDSSGISELLKLHRKVEEQGATFEVRNPTPTVRRVLEITGLLEKFGVS